MNVQNIPIDKIIIGETERLTLNVNRAEEDKSLGQLANSIKTFGLLSPIVVQENSEGTYLKVVGTRRILAFKLNKATTIPAIVLPKNKTRKELYVFTYEENSKRQDLDSLSSVELLLQCIAYFCLESLEQDAQQFSKKELVLMGKNFFQKARYFKQQRDKGENDKLSIEQSAIYYSTFECLEQMGVSFHYFNKKIGVLGFDVFVKKLLLSDAINLATAKILHVIYGKDKELFRRIQLEVEIHAKELDEANIEFKEFKSLCAVCIEKYSSIVKYGSIDNATYSKRVSKRLANMSSNLSLVQLEDNERHMISEKFQEIEAIIANKLGDNRFKKTINLNEDEE